MFRKKPKNRLKEIEEWPTTLDGYGLFVNAADQIRLICKPEEKMIYRLSSSMEYNDRRLAAFRRTSPQTLAFLRHRYWITGDVNGRGVVEYGDGEVGKVGDEEGYCALWRR
jgi:hypothetical protein